MKKLIILITVSLLGVNLLTGCGKDNKIKVEDKKENIVLTFFGFKVGETQYEMLEKLIMKVLPMLMDILIYYINVLMEKKQMIYLC